MRVLFLHLDSFGGHGGIAKFNRDLIAAMATHPLCREVVALPRYLLRQPEPIPPRVRFDRGGLGGKSSYLLRCLGWAVGGGRFDLVICGHVNLLPYAAIWRPIVGRWATLVTHGIEAWQPAANPAAVRIAHRLDRFVAVSDLTRRRFAAWSGVPESAGAVLPNCVDLSRFSPGPPRSDLASRLGLTGKRVILTLGRLEARERTKGIDEVLDVLPDLATSVPNLVYAVAGDGSDRKRLEARAAAPELAGRVVFLGHVPEEEKADVYRLADVFALPSRGEGFGIVLLEAMACGVPVVASRLDAGREALANGTLGSLVDPTDAASVRDGILAALGRPRGVPKGLDRFSDRAFERRVHRLLGRLFADDGPIGPLDDVVAEH
jgi:glycosyltransferase involved in cell wall biosynthesis